MRLINLFYIMYEQSVYIYIYEKRGMEKSDESRTRRDEQRRKYSKMDKRVKDKLVRSPRGNGCHVIWEP